MVSKEDLGLIQENDRLSRENRILKDCGKSYKGHGLLREPKAVRFRFIEELRNQFPTKHLSRVTDVSARGLHAFSSRPASRRPRSDLVTLAHIRCPSGYYAAMSREGQNIASQPEQLWQATHDRRAQKSAWTLGIAA